MDREGTEIGPLHLSHGQPRGKRPSSTRAASGLLSSHRSTPGPGVFGTGRHATTRAARTHSRTRTGSEMASRRITLHKHPLQDHKAIPVAIHHVIPNPHFRRRYVSAESNIVG